MPAKNSDSAGGSTTASQTPSSSRANHIPHTPDELVAVVDEKDTIIGKATRDEVHKKGILHREVFCYLINAKKQLLLQKRSDTGKWDHSVGGHFPFSQTYEEGIRREFEEELGYIIPASDFKEIGKEKITHTSHSGTNIRFVKIFLVQKDIPLSDLNPDPGEVEKVEYFTKAELRELFTHPDKITTNLRFLIEKYVMKYLG